MAQPDIANLAKQAEELSKQDGGEVSEKQQKDRDGRFSDGFIVTVGDTVDYDSEAEFYGVPSKVGQKVPTDAEKRVKEAAAALKQAQAAASAAKAALKAERPSQLTVIRQAIITNEEATTEELLATLAERGHPNAKKEIVTSYRSDALAFLRLLRDMGRLHEVEEEAEAGEGEPESAKPARRQRKRTAA